MRKVNNFKKKDHLTLAISALLADQTVCLSNSIQSEREVTLSNDITWEDYHKKVKEQTQAINSVSMKEYLKTQPRTFEALFSEDGSIREDKRSFDELYNRAKLTEGRIKDMMFEVIEQHLPDAALECSQADTDEEVYEQVGRYVEEGDYTTLAQMCGCEDEWEWASTYLAGRARE